MSACQCQICLGDLFAMYVSALSCGHMFHRDCATKWKAVRPNCPTCKQIPTSIVPTLYFNAGEDEDVEKDVKNSVGLKLICVTSIYLFIDLLSLTD